MRWDHYELAGCPPCLQGWSRPRDCCSCEWGWGTWPPACSTSSAPPGSSRWSGQTPLRSHWQSCQPGEPSPDLTHTVDGLPHTRHQPHLPRRWRSGGCQSIALSVSWWDLSAPAWSAPRPCVGSRRERTPPTAVMGRVRVIEFEFDILIAQFQLGTLTWAPSFPLTSLGISVWDHFEVPHGDTWVRSVLKFTVFSLLWINCRMFQAKSLCLKEILYKHFDTRNREKF